MKRKITLLLLSALLVSGMANAQHGFKSEPIWAYSWGVGMGTMVPQGNLVNISIRLCTGYQLADITTTCL